MLIFTAHIHLFEGFLVWWYCVFEYVFRYAYTNWNTSQHPQTTIPKATNKNTNRKRNITWFNPPYNKHIASDIGKQFRNLIDICFLPTNNIHIKQQRITDQRKQHKKYNK